MKNMLKALTKAENGIMFAAFAVMVASSFAQVVNRNFFISRCSSGFRLSQVPSVFVPSRLSACLLYHGK